VIALVGNKLDLCNETPASSGAAEEDEDEEVEGGDEDARKVSTREAKNYAEEEGLLFFETSAKTGARVQEVFEAIANAIPETSLKGRRGENRNTQGAEDQSRVNLTGPRADAGQKDGCAC